MKIKKKRKETALFFKNAESSLIKGSQSQGLTTTLQFDKPENTHLYSGLQSYKFGFNCFISYKC